MHTMAKYFSFSAANDTVETLNKKHQQRGKIHYVKKQHWHWKRTLMLLLKINILQINSYRTIYVDTAPTQSFISSSIRI